MIQLVLFDPPCSGPGDYHAHIFPAGTSAVANPRYIPDYAATLDEYLEQLRVHGLSWGTLVQPSFLGTDNSFLLDALRQRPDRLRGVVVLDELDPVRTCPDLSVWSRLGVRGVRLNLIGRTVPDLASAAWSRILTQMSELGWHLEFQAKAEQLRELTAVIQDLPCEVVIDHVGLPDSSDLTSHPLSQLSQFDNVWVKASGRYRSPDRFAESFVDALLDRNFNRLIFGSDWPHTRFENEADSTWDWALRPELQPTV